MLIDERTIYSTYTDDPKLLHFRHFHGSAGHKDGKLAEAVLNDPAYFKFAVVRHPWKRLVSAYRSKYEGQCNFQRFCMSKEFDLPVGEHSDFLSFHEFVSALASQDVAEMNSHFRPMVYMCELNRIKYDFVADLGEISDTNFISHKLGYKATYHEQEAEYAATVAGPKYWGGRTHTVHNCTAETVILAKKIYRQDAAILGYSFDDAMIACRDFGKTQVVLPDAVKS